jgi:DNA modification methylase/ParB-like chromosome segregation protein Spo0J
MRLVPIREIKVPRRFRRDLGDIQALAESIKEVGLIHPVVINSRNELVAGYRRLEAAKLLGWEKIPAVRLNIDPIQGVYHENLVRKDLTVRERLALAEALEGIEREKARQRKEQAPGKPRGKKKVSPGNLPGEKGRALDRVAKAVGWSRHTYEKAKAVAQAAEENPEKYGDLLEVMEEVSVESAYNELVRRRDIERRIQAAPKVVDGLILGDALEEVPKLPDESIDLLLTDPPYGEAVARSGSRRRLVRVRGWEQNPQPDAFELIDKVLAKAEPKLKPGAHVYIFTNWRSWGRLQEIAEKYFRVRNCLIAPHPVSLGGMGDSAYRKSYTMILFATKGEGRKLLRPNQPDILPFVRPKIKHHPAEKSVEILRYLIENSTVEGEVVLDPFCGSGSTLVAAKETGRRYIGIEKDPRWYEVARGRLGG